MPQRERWIEGHSVLAHVARDDDEAIDAVPFIQGAHPASVPVTVEVIDVLPELSDADLLKIDIEGGEWPILADGRFSGLPARAVVLEYHPQGAPTSDPAADAARLLREAGFTPGPTFDVQGTTGLMWAWKAAA